MFETELVIFFRYLATEKRYSVHTISNYTRDLNRFIDFCRQSGIDDWQSIDSQHIRNYLARLHRQGLAAKSIHRMLSSIRSLFKYLLRRHKLAKNPAMGVSAPKVQRKLPEVVTPDDLSHLMSLNENDPLAVRDMAMMELLYGCGLRLAELVTLDMTDIEWQSQTITVTGKGNRQRTTPFGRHANEALKKWITKRSLFIKDDDKAVFVSRQGNRISHASVQQRMKKWAGVKGMKQRIYPHLMRHSFASHLLESSKDLRAVQELLGHANLSTTQIYTHLDFQHLAKVYDSAHPRAKKK
ncbi:MAG: tyrosine recombinase XerC [Gammaproteobacteria bacterium]|nr:tyrosine recombinase XerC [Gammaproteobacteria bacterium]